MKNSDLEEAVLKPVDLMQQTVAGYRLKGYRIIFISDMYLPSCFLRPILKKYGFFQDGDCLFVSCEHGNTKEDGGLFRIVRDSLHLSFHRWVHMGDNPKGDGTVPRALGIKVRRVCHNYSAVQKKWKMQDCPTDFKYGGILAGISRSLQLSDKGNSRTSILVDMVAPLYCSFCGKVLEDAKSRGIDRLYFCARDAFQMYNVALEFSEQYPEIEMRYFYASRASMKDTSEDVLLRLFVQEGLASKEQHTAIVDCTSTGRTLSIINRTLHSAGYNDVFGYYLIKYDGDTYLDYKDAYYSIVRQKYSENPLIHGLLNHIPAFECMMSANTQRRTIGYSEDSQGHLSPVFSQEDDKEGISQPNLQYWEEYYLELLRNYSRAYKESGLLDYSTEVLNNISVPTLLSFFNFPSKEYMAAFEGITLNERSGRYDVAYVFPGGPLALLPNLLKKPYWKRGTIVYNLPPCISNIYLRAIRRLNYSL